MATAPIRPLELDLLCQKLDTDYAAHITGTGTSPKSRRSDFLSKAIAAFVLHEEAGASLEESVAVSIDGGQDHGIDSVFVSNDQTIWLVQSKYKDSGSGEPELGNVSKLRDGVTDLIRGRWERFKNAFQTRHASIADASNSGICKVKVDVTDVHGRQINPANLRYIGYLIADLTPSLHRQVFGRYHRTADSEGYFSPLATGNGYTEILSYDKLIKDANRRNRVLFDKLGLHKN